MSKVILISIDGMRPDGLKACKNSFLETLMQTSAYTFEARTVFPSVTLPCHLSMFYSIPPERHGTTTNTFVPPVRPVAGLLEQLKAAGKKSAMYFGWEQLRNIGKPGCLVASEFLRARSFDFSDGILTDRAMQFIEAHKPDFVFLYMVETDEKGGHDAGWMSGTYLDYISRAMDNAKRVMDAFGDEYTVIITADHGGHDRCHGTELPEDMTIPMFFCGKDFAPNTELKDVSILDIAPTVADIMHIYPAEEWEGTSLLQRR